ncbi:hypothetical protein MKW98_020102 [Papaver atlanticum]|uniref:Uncharacterized protein n=1 Tax=Papaver atlanticum TaxID=357466 RepID=A0AAD4S175_9MAGN|nr:hypothetical protein MKW98_020102 [Papaver atlanticum]
MESLWNNLINVQEDCKSSGVAYIYWSASEGVDKGDLKFSRCGCETRHISKTTNKYQRLHRSCNGSWMQNNDDFLIELIFSSAL